MAVPLMHKWRKTPGYGSQWPKTERTRNYRAARSSIIRAPVKKGDNAGIAPHRMQVCHAARTPEKRITFSVFGHPARAHAAHAKH